MTAYIAALLAVLHATLVLRDRASAEADAAVLRERYFRRLALVSLDRVLSLRFGEGEPERGVAMGIL